MPKRTGNPFPFDPLRDLPRGTLFDVFRYIATWQEVQEACELLRERLAPTHDSRIPTTYRGRLLLRALWAALKRIGDGDVPPWPKPLNRDTYSALFKKGVQSVEPERFYFECRRRTLAAIAVVELWCEANAEMPKSESPAAAPPAATHSADFTSVKWFGATYQFAKGLQAESVRVLWEAWETGAPTLSQQTIGEKARSSNDRFRLEHVFRPTKKSTGKREAHPAWGRMIKSVGKGVFALSPP